MYLGVLRDGADRVGLDPDHLTTHAVCLGMTGSGKTGLGVVALEELARRGVPLLVVDLKGDMVNLLLTFPGLSAEEFAPWLPADAVAGRDRAAVAAEQAAAWRSGLERSGLGPADVGAVRSGVAWQLLTPGVASGAPVNILPALSAPPGWEPDSDPDGATDRVNGVVSALLSLVGRGGDPLTDRDHVLVASIILEHWRRHDALDLVQLLKSVADPPMEALGALPLEAFYPRPERLKLVMELNTLLASPAFAAWTRGLPLTMPDLLGTPEAPRASIVSVAHLDERQRLFVLGLLFSELMAWVRRQPASAGLRALLYLDEVQGILPPHPANPPTKPALLTLLKQGRAFGVGAWLATQNPVDLDYKALGNAGVKLVGRLVTERDRERALEGLAMDRLPDGSRADDVVAGLGKREFLLDDVRAEPRVRTFSSRFALSYLRGPVTLAEMRPLLAAAPPTATGRPGAPPAPSTPTPAAARGGPPLLQTPIPVRFLASGAGLARPILLVRDRLTLEQRSLSLYRVEEELWRVPVGDSGGLDWDAAERLQSEPELVAEPPSSLTFPGALPSALERDLKGATGAFLGWRAAQPVSVLANPKLKLAAELDEGREAFRQRCLIAADRADDREQDAIRARYERRIQTLKDRLRREQTELERDQQEARSRKMEEGLGVVEGLFSVLLGSRGVRSAASKALSRGRSAATRRRMTQNAQGDVEESVREIERLEQEIEDLAAELDAEIARVAEASEALAEEIEVLPIRPKRTDIQAVSLELVWVG
jgi:hypothetical protein